METQNFASPRDGFLLTPGEKKPTESKMNNEMNCLSERAHVVVLNICLILSPV